MMSESTLYVRVRKDLDITDEDKNVRILFAKTQKYTYYSRDVCSYVSKVYLMY